MKNDQILDDISCLLAFMNEELEQQGATLNELKFYFSPPPGKDEDREAFLKQYQWTPDRFDKIVKICKSRELIKSANAISDPLCFILTEHGKAQAISAMHGKNRSYELTEKMVIHNVNISGGNAQIGNNNIQHITNLINNIMQEIDKADISEQEKGEAKSLVMKVSENQTLSNIISGLFVKFASIPNFF